MRRIHIIGRKNSGKTTLMVDLVQELNRLGFCVGTIKHTHHQHELDTPGKDSHRHKEAGAATVGILSQSMNAVFWPPDRSGSRSKESRYEEFEPMFADCDLVLVEGDSQTTALKMEVWRMAVEATPMAASDDLIAAVITDDPLECKVPVLPRKDIAEIAGHVVSILELS